MLNKNGQINRNKNLSLVSLTFFVPNKKANLYLDLLLDWGLVKDDLSTKHDIAYESVENICLHERYEMLQLAIPYR